MAKEQFVINPILVQAYSGKAATIKDHQPAPSSSGLWSEMYERIAGQIEAGSSVTRYFAPDQPATIEKLSESRRHDLDIAYSLAQAMGSNAVSYYLSETALAVPKYGDHYLLSVTDALRSGHEALLRTEEGLTDTAADIAAQVAWQALSLHTDNGKVHATIPGHKSAIPTTGWWTFFSNGDKRLLPNIPSCEMFMTATTLDQAALGDSVVRIVPYGMEDREVAVHRILQMLNRPVNAFSIITAPSGDIKKIRHWGNAQKPAELQDLYQSRRVDGLAAEAANTLSKQARDRYAYANRHLGSLYSSPNQQRTLAEALSALCGQPYECLKLYEKFKPNQAEGILHPLSQLNTLLEQDSSATPTLLSLEYTPGKNTNSTIEACFSLATTLDGNGRQIQFSLRTVLSRANDSDIHELGVLLRDKPSLEVFANRLANNGKLYYILLEGEKAHE